MCGWEQDRTDDFDWTRHQGPITAGYVGKYAVTENCSPFVCIKLAQF